MCLCVSYIIIYTNSFPYSIYLLHLTTMSHQSTCAYTSFRYIHLIYPGYFDPIASSMGSGRKVPPALTACSGPQTHRRKLIDPITNLWDRVVRCHWPLQPAAGPQTQCRKLIDPIANSMGSGRKVPPALTACSVPQTHCGKLMPQRHTS